MKFPKDMPLADRIHREPRRAGLTLAGLASRARISKTYLWELEHDQEGLKRPSAETLVRLSRALDVEVGDLIADVYS